MRTLMVAGGPIDIPFAEGYCRKNFFDYVIGIDRGAAFLQKHGMKMDLLVGDFDSLDAAMLSEIEAQGTKICRLNPHKDAADTEIALEYAIQASSDEIIILGATGARIDHLLANIQILVKPMRLGIQACLVDKNNRISLHEKPFSMKKEEQYGKYVSFLPLTTEVSGVYLEGFAYPLTDYTYTSEESLGVSNEIVEKEAHVSFKQGILIMVEASD